jgi:hypothetical protein
MADNDVNARVSHSHVTSGKAGFATMGSGRAVDSSQLHRQVQRCGWQCALAH